MFYATNIAVPVLFAGGWLAPIRWLCSSLAPTDQVMTAGNPGGVKLGLERAAGMCEGVNVIHGEPALHPDPARP